MSDLKIIHNPRCSKSRQTLQLLQDKGLKPQVLEYLKTPLSSDELSTIIQQLGFTTARQLLRKGENAYKEHNLKDETISESELIQAMLDSPKLIERPIVLFNGKAKIGRPPESVLDIL
jgi:arsenate reductase